MYWTTKSATDLAKKDFLFLYSFTWYHNAARGIFFLILIYIVF